MYIHERAQWPHFNWDEKIIIHLLTEVRHLQGRLLGRMDTLGFQVRQEATLQILMHDVVKSSEIEGENLNAEQVRSSIAKRLGINIMTKAQTNRHIEGIVEVMLDATRHYDAPLTKERLYEWHKVLFLEANNSLRSMVIGKWRTKKSGVMQVVSGPIGRQRVHFEAPDYGRLKKEMTTFINWFNGPSETDLILKAALAHFWFVTIHPFDDGNGRIARAIADMLLARSEGSSQRFFSMSTQIQQERSTYYKILENCQKGPLDITPWMEWFLNCLKRAISASDNLLDAILKKARFWNLHSSESFNQRQRLVINRLLDGFYGKLTSSKWAKLTKCSQDSALRDINDLLERRILIKDEAGGRSTGYHLEW